MTRDLAAGEVGRRIPLTPDLVGQDWGSAPLPVAVQGCFLSEKILGEKTS